MLNSNNDKIIVPKRYIRYKIKAEACPDENPFIITALRVKHHHCFLVQHVSHSHEASPGQESVPAPEPAAANQLALKSCSGFLPVLGNSAWSSLCQNHPSCLSVLLITVIPSVSGVFSLFFASLKEQVTCPCSCFKSVPWAWSSKGFLFAFFVFYFLASIWPVEFSGNLIVGHVVIVLAVEEWINKFDVFSHREVLQIWETRQRDGMTTHTNKRKNCNREKIFNDNYDFQLFKQVAVQAVMTPLQQDDNFSLTFHLVKIHSVSFFSHPNG